MFYQIIHIETGKVIAECGSFRIAFKVWNQQTNRFDYDIVRSFHYE